VSLRRGEESPITNQIQGIDAVIFDMDGTLVDSEVIAEQVVLALLEEHGLDTGNLDAARFHGWTWENTAAGLVRLFPSLDGVPVADELARRFSERFEADFPREIPGATAAVRRAVTSFDTAIVSSSERDAIDYVVAGLGIAELLDVIVSSEDCTRSKPDPQGYLIAAERLGREPPRCLVFEDSLAGLTAARAAGMRAVAVTQGKTGAALAAVRARADLAVQDFEALPASFFDLLDGAGVL